MPARSVNLFETTLGADALVGDNTLLLATGEGARLQGLLADVADPLYDGVNALAAGQWLDFTLVDGATIEYVRLTGPWNNGGTANLLGGAGGGTLTRHVDGSTASAWSAATAAVQVRQNRALYSAMSQPDRIETITAAKTFADDLLFVGAPGAAAGMTVGVADDNALPVAPATRRAKPHVRRMSTGMPAFFALLDALGSSNGRTPSVPYLPTPLTHDFTFVAANGSTAWSQTGSQGQAVASGTNIGLQNYASGSLLGELPRHRYQSAATANASAYLQPSGASLASGPKVLSRGNAAGRGEMIAQFLIELTTITGGGRWFIGHIGGSAADPFATANPGSLLSTPMVGMGCDDADANLTIITAIGDGVTAATKTAFNLVPRTKVGASGLLFEITLGWEPQSGVIGVRIREAGGAAYSGGAYGRTVLHEGTIAATLPAPTAALRWHVGCNSGNTAAAAQQFGFSRYLHIARW